MNVVCLVGRLIADPELRQTPQGTAVCQFTVSVNRSTKGDDGYYKTDLIRCVAWRQSAEFVRKYFHKGNNIGVNGSIQVSSYTDKDTGKKLSSYEVLANNLYFVESRNSSSQSQGNVSYSQPAPKATENNFPASSFSTGDLDGFSQIATDDGDLPF